MSCAETCELSGDHDSGQTRLHLHACDRVADSETGGDLVDRERFEAVVERVDPVKPSQNRWDAAYVEEEARCGPVRGTGTGHRLRTESHLEEVEHGREQQGDAACCEHDGEEEAAERADDRELDRDEDELLRSA